MMEQRELEVRKQEREQQSDAEKQLESKLKQEWEARLSQLEASLVV